MFILLLGHKTYLNVASTILNLSDCIKHCMWYPGMSNVSMPNEISKTSLTLGTAAIKPSWQVSNGHSGTECGPRWPSETWQCCPGCGKDPGGKVER